MDYECRMSAQNQKMQEDENKRASKVNAKKAARVTKRGSSFVILLVATANLPSNTETSDDPRDPLLQVLLYLFTDNIKEYFYYLV